MLWGRRLQILDSKAGLYGLRGEAIGFAIVSLVRWTRRRGTWGTGCLLLLVLGLGLLPVPISSRGDIASRRRHLCIDACRMRCDILPAAMHLNLELLQIGDSQDVFTPVERCKLVLEHDELQISSGRGDKSVVTVKTFEPTREQVAGRATLTIVKRRRAPSDC